MTLMILHFHIFFLLPTVVIDLSSHRGPPTSWPLALNPSLYPPSKNLSTGQFYLLHLLSVSLPLRPLQYHHPTAKSILENVFCKDHFQSRV